MVYTPYRSTETKTIISNLVTVQKSPNAASIDKIH